MVEKAARCSYNFKMLCLKYLFHKFVLRIFSPTMSSHHRFDVPLQHCVKRNSADATNS